MVLQCIHGRQQRVSPCQSRSGGGPFLSHYGVYEKSLLFKPSSSRNCVPAVKFPTPHVSLPPRQRRILHFWHPSLRHLTVQLFSQFSWKIALELPTRGSGPEIAPIRRGYLLPIDLGGLIGLAATCAYTGLQRLLGAKFRANHCTGSGLFQCPKFTPFVALSRCAMKIG